MIHLSKTAATEVLRMQQSRGQQDSLLRLRVDQGGCSGLYYSLELEPINGFQVENLNGSNEDILFETEGISIIVDNKSHSYLDGTKLHYSEDLMGGGFRFQNPYAAKTCRCGLSFAVNEDNS